jgi:hypothetical protein
MSLSLTQFTRSLKVHASTYDIPAPYILAEGQQDDFPYSQVEGYFVLSTTPLKSNGVTVGDVVYVYNGGVFQFVTTVQTITTDDFWMFTTDAIPTNYTFVIYQQSTKSGLGNQGCFLMSVNDSVTIDVETLTGNTITGIILNSNDVLPIQVRKLLTTTNENAIYALW